MRCLLTCLCLLAVSFSLAAPASNSRHTKVIEWGWDEPDPAFMRANQERMDNMGFDGVIFHAMPVHDGKPVNFAWTCWSSTVFRYEEFASNIEDLQACRFDKLTDNFLRFNVCPGNVDWFDDTAFDAVLNNARVAARVAREGGCKGFMFDIEIYNEPLWTYAKQAHCETRGFAEYMERVTDCGARFMRAINSEYPDIVVLLTYGYGITGGVDDADKRPYGLLRGFLDGMFKVAAPKTVIVDAYEGAYTFRTHQQFVNGYRSVREGVLPLVANPAKYKKHVEVGFGIWMDAAWRTYGWHTDDLSKNFFTPDEFEYSVFCGLDVTDRYVWIYTECPRWWTRQDLPAAYQRALRRSRRPHEINDAAYVGRIVKDVPAPPPPKASAQPGYDDKATFGDLENKYEFIADLPKVWQFRTDPDSVGVKDGWFRPGIPADGWGTMEIGKFWDEQDLRYTGHAWYRLDWTAPEFNLPRGKRLKLWFGAADEQAEVWVNGMRAGQHKLDPDLGWDKRFAIDVTGKLLPGQPNTIAVRIQNLSLAGGLWKSVKLAVER